MSAPRSLDDWALAEARNTSTAELRSAAECVYWQMNDPDLTPDDRAFLDASARPYFDAYQHELERRERMHGLGVTNPYREHDEALSVLRDAIRDQVEVADLLAREGLPVIRGRLESHGMCPVCGGKDRFVIRHAPNSRGWCRQCRVFGDAIAIASTAWGTGFADTVTRLAVDYLGLRIEAAA